MGSITGLYAHPARAGTFLVAGASCIAFWFAGIDFTSLKWADRCSRLTLSIGVEITVPFLFLPVYADRHDLLAFDGDAVRYLGLVIHAAGCLPRIGPMFALKNRFRAPWTAQKPQYLVTTGFYRYIRHPSYLGVVLAAPGWFLVLRCWIGFVAWVPVFPFGIPQIRKEEQMLRDELGDEYAAYPKRIWMLPFIR
jgi:protein-S-isoprenylcysteine O-methyltransferase Ste14